MNKSTIYNLQGFRASDRQQDKFLFEREIRRIDEGSRREFSSRPCEPRFAVNNRVRE